MFLSKLSLNRRGDIHLNFGKGTAKVYYEDNAIAHIKADNEEIAGFALGYVHAVDRLWQMEYLRRVAQGKLSEVFGKVALPIDKAMRTIGIRNSCENIESLFHDKNALNYYKAYVKGINEYAKQNILPIQFQMFWLEFEDWTVVDC